MILRKIILLAASIIKFIILLIFLSKSYADENIIKKFGNDKGIVAIMYHRFNENEYPSTNIQIETFKEQIKIIKDSGFDFYDPKNFKKNFELAKKNKTILLTIDDAFKSFYEHAWPYLKKEKIPFILFVSTEPTNKYGYMSWDEIREVEKENFAFIGNHSHSHEYLINFEHKKFKKDIDQSIKIFEKELGYNPIFFSYPFGEFSLKQKEYIMSKFEFAFGQHSGVIDFNKDKYELPRFPINQKYGELERFKFLTNLNPLEYKSVSVDDKYILASNNPPKLSIEFFQSQKNINNISCYSNEGEEWNKTNLEVSDKTLNIFFKEKFKFRRGRLNCSLKDDIGWRWFGLQFTIQIK